MEEREECRTKAEMEQELEALRAENETLKERVTQVSNDREYWTKAWNEEYCKTKVYANRLKNMQHTIALLAGMIGEVDVTALTKEEKA